MPEEVVVDRGLHNRGIFAKTLLQCGTQIFTTALESPEQLGSVESHGGLWKDIAKRVISAKRIDGDEQMELLAAEINNIKNYKKI